MAKLTWNEETVAALHNAASAYNGQITQSNLVDITAAMSALFDKETSTRSIGSKLRKEGFDVQKASEVVSITWSKEDGDELKAFLESNAGQFTYAEIAANVAEGRFNSRQVQGKILHLEMTGMVKPTEKTVAPRKFTPEQESLIVELTNKGSSMEAIASALGHDDVRKVQGKTLSLYREGRIQVIPKRETTSERAKEDMLEGINVEEKTVAELAQLVNKTERGVKSMLSRRGLKAKDYDGAAKRAKLDAKA